MGCGSSAPGNESTIKNNVKIVMVGLDGSGKTTLLYRWKMGEVVNTIPTTGFNVETLDNPKGPTFTVWDLGGQGREQWKSYYGGVDGLIYVVDSTAPAPSLTEAREELFKVVKDDPADKYKRMQDIPVLVLANKHDLQGSAPASDILDALTLIQLAPRKWEIVETSAITGEGTKEALDALDKLIKDSKKAKAKK